MRTRWIAVSSSLFGVFGLVVACSAGDGRPDPSNPVINPDASSSGSSSGGDASDAKNDGPDEAACRNTKLDSNETDIDCGGGVCPRCPLGKKCLIDGDCADGASCTNGLCAKCKDGIANGDETDVDCGGKACGPCGTGKRCSTGPDCKSESCSANACACPANMTIVALATGGAYCIDTAEVTKGQYNKFITANVPVGTQGAECAPPTNSTFVPRGAWPPSTDPTLAFNLGLPVHYVDWCDAAAYCKWAKKQLCGSHTGAPVPPADVNLADKDSWFNACTAQGSKTYPYGNFFGAAQCNSNGKSTAEGGAGAPATYGLPNNGDMGVYTVATSDNTGGILTYTNTLCQGGSVGLYQMSGNLGEWEDSCDGTTPGAKCAVRGGSYAANSDPSASACTASRKLERNPAPPLNVNDPDALADVGIRCCLY